MIDWIMGKFMRFLIGDFKEGGIVPGAEGNLVPLLPGEEIYLKDDDKIKCVLEKNLEFFEKRTWWHKQPEIDLILKGKAVRRMDKDTNESGNKYLRHVVLKAPPVQVGEHWIGVVDVYSVLDAFKVICPAIAHAVKKLLCPGTRGKGCGLQDISESKDAIIRAYQMERARVAIEIDNVKKRPPL